MSTENDIMLAEYHAAQEMLRHYDTLNWQIGAILIGATTILTGLTLQSSVVELLQERSLLSFAVMLGMPFFSFVILRTWHQWFQRHRDLYNLRNETMHRIELSLGMYHHLRSAEADLRNNKEKNAHKLEVLEAAKQRVGYGSSFTPLYELKPLGRSGADLAWFMSRFIPGFHFVLLTVITFA